MSTFRGLYDVSVCGVPKQRVADVASASPDKPIVESFAKSPVGGATKRALDVVVGIVALLLLLPLCLVIAAAIKLFEGGSVFYGHPRVGYRSRMFNCWKFRTMAEGGEALLAEHFRKNPSAKVEWELTRKLKDDPRVNKLGRFLRASSLDELPQILNVIRGDMSLVGPRPVTQSELVEKYGKRSTYYLRARPGVTGLWQVSGRSDVAYEDRVLLDCKYLNQWSLALDLKIIAKTVPAALSRAGSY
jgi:exopolysaccharide production protein ExoY